MPGILIDPAFRKRRTEANEVAKVMLSDECDRRTAALLFIAWQAIRIFWVWLRTMRQPHFERSDFRSKLFDLNQILGSPAYASAQMRQHPMATSVTMNTMNKGAFR